MYTFDLAAKLRRINPDLYINTDAGREIVPGWRVGGIYLRRPDRREARVSTQLMSGARRQVYEAATSGNRDKFICGTSLTFVPEYDIFDMSQEECELIAVGWRTIALHLVKQKLATLDKVKRVFRCSSLGDYKYDNMGFAGKQALAKQELENGNKHDLRI